MEKNFSQVTDARWYPQYHLAAPFGWCNDPNGMCCYRGQYHFFYQHYPYEPRWGPMHWGHAVSDDLAHWKHLPIALTPEQPYELDGYFCGCFSGSAIEKDDKLWLMYTGHVSKGETQCLAYSDDGVHFEKFAGNPIIGNVASEEISGGDCRDPKIWKHDGKYYAVIGSCTPGKERGQILLFESADLIHWAFKNISARSKGAADLGKMWECPNFAELDGQDVLIFSPIHLDTSNDNFYHDKASGVLIGKLDYATGIFNHGDFQYLDKGFDFYAPQVMQAPDGRTILIGWLATWFIEMPETQDGWAGQMTVPRELHIKDGKIISTPVKELKKLRDGQPVVYDNLSVTEPTKLDGISGLSCELLMTIDAAKSKKFSIAVRAGEDEQTVLTYDTDGTFKLDRSKSGVVCRRYANYLAKTIGEPVNNVRELKVAPTDKLKLHIFIDRSSMEVFINDGAEVFSARIYPKRESQDIIFTPEDKVFAINRVEFYKLNSGFC